MLSNISKCGNNCDRCPSYKDNLRTEEDRRTCSQGWHRYHGFRLSPEKLVQCDGCQPLGENGNGTRYISCLIRRCALYNKVQTCAHCADYPCDVLTSRVLGEAWITDLSDRLGPIPEQDYDLYVEPYLGIKHLDSIRIALTPEDINPIQPVSLTPRIAPYPRGFEPGGEYHPVYKLLEAINKPIQGLPYAQAEVEKEARTHLLKILWAFARYGTFDPKSKSLHLDHKIYLAQKIHSSYQRVCGYFETLAGYGVRCEVIPLNEDRWLTPTGALRRQGARDTSPPWEMVMRLDESLGGAVTLILLQTYAQSLAEQYGKTAYRRFARADLQILAAN